MKLLADSGATVEFCLTSNLLLGVVPSLESHPIRQFVEARIPVTLNTDDPIRMCTDLGREYEQAASLGFSVGELFEFTRQGIRASFASDQRKAVLLEAIEDFGSQCVSDQRGNFVVK